MSNNPSTRVLFFEHGLCAAPERLVKGHPDPRPRDETFTASRVCQDLRFPSLVPSQAKPAASTLVVPMGDSAMNVVSEILCWYALAHVHVAVRNGQ